jgi:GH24 family phage-related lysozyme (muramidase)
MSYLDDSVAQLQIFEGVIPWMYLDTRGFVTVGVGELLAAVGRAQALPFIDSNGNPVTTDVILAEFNRVLALAKGQAAGAYQTNGSPTLSASSISNLLMAHVQYFDGQLSARFANYAAFPDAAKLGLLDMIYNLGPQGLFGGYPTFMSDVTNGNWAGAAAQCYRNGPSAARNQWTQQQFLAAAAAPAPANQ